MTLIAIPPDELINQSLSETVQKPPEVSKEGMVNFWAMSGVRGSILPGRGTRDRLFALRNWYFADEQTNIRGAFSGIAKHGASLPWEITGDDKPSDLFAGLGQELGYTTPTGVEYYQTVLRQSNFGAGWGQLMTQVWNDFLRYDTGAYIEVIGRGDSWTPLNGAITGLAHLDPLRCIPTGDPHFPVVYYDRWGGLHVMHFTRVIMLQDMNDGDDLFPGWGDAALSRAISIAVREMWMTRYIQAYLDDEPAPGLDLIGGIVKGEFERAEQQYKQQQQMDTKPVWGKRMRYYTADPAIMPKIESVDFQKAPVSFDYRVYTDINIDILALAIGVDRQELMALASGSGVMGSEGQSIILHQKSKGKTIGFLITELERRFNDILPDGFTFTFKPRDTQEARETAENANLWGDFVQKAKEFLTPEQAQILLSSQVEAVHDAISDAPRVNDVDIPLENTPVVAADDTAGAEQIATETPEQPPAAPPETQKAGWDEGKHPRAEDGQFGSGGGGIGVAAGIARDASGQPEYIPEGHGKPYVKNPYYSGKPSGKPAPSTPDKKPTPKPDKPDKKPAADKPQPKKPETSPKPAAGKKPEWQNYQKRKPGVDSEGYQDYAGMDNDKPAQNRAYALSDSHTKTLSKGQREAAETYTGGDYEPINGGLRQGNVPREYQTTVKNLDSAISQSKLPENTVLYRGTSLSPERMANIKPGATFSDPAYTSTSINPRIPDSFARGEGKTMMRIKAPAGTNGLAVNNVSNFDGEHEVLLPRGTNYRVTNVYKDKKTGLTYVDAEIIGSAA
jgi:ADP-ribosyltransferase exoenzyme